MNAQPQVKTFLLVILVSALVFVDCQRYRAFISTRFSYLVKGKPSPPRFFACSVLSNDKSMDLQFWRDRSIIIPAPNTATYGVKCWSPIQTTNFLYNTTCEIEIKLGVVSIDEGEYHCLLFVKGDEKARASQNVKVLGAYKCSFQVSYCEKHLCPYYNTPKCQVCESQHGPSSGNAYQLSPDGTECLVRCSWKGNWCWPGSCTSTSTTNDTCTCASGFINSPKCNHIDVLPVISIFESKPKDFYRVSLPVHENFIKEDPYYINVTVIAVHRTSLSNYSKNNRPWITSFVDGIVSVKLTVRIWRRNQILNVFVSNVSMTCNKPFSFRSPANVALNCAKEVVVPYYLYDGDKLQTEVFISNGAHITINDLDWATFDVHYYTGKTLAKSSIYTLDQKKPSVLGNSADFFAVNFATQKNNLSVFWNWSAWSDGVGSQVSKTFKVEMYELEEKYFRQYWWSQLVKHIVEKSQRSGYKDIPKENGTASFSFPSSGLYSFILTVSDNVGNVRLCRRLAFYSSNPKVAIDANYPVSITNAKVDFYGHSWQHFSKFISVNWSGHFESRSFNRAFDRFQRVGDFVDVDYWYDQPSVTRVVGNVTLHWTRTSGLTNKYGVVVLKWALTNLTAPEPSEKQFKAATAMELTAEAMTIFQNFRDGDSIRIWLKAFDWFEAFATANSTVYVDTTPPLITGLSLGNERSNRSFAFFNTTQLHLLNFRFYSYDPHSGLQRLQWVVKSLSDRREIDKGFLRISTVSKENCSQINCSCSATFSCVVSAFFGKASSSIPDGQQGRSYSLSIIATNNAGLTHMKDLHFIIDVTKPIAGDVIDNVQGAMDIDYQQFSTLFASWHGFKDPESGILFYNYAVGSKCIGTDDLIKGENKTALPWLSVANMIPGKYFVSVIAANGALEFSSVVCSDGIVVDNTPPLLTEIRIQHARSVPGLIRQHNLSEIWIIDQFRQRIGVLPYDMAGLCANVSATVDSVSLYPLLSAETINNFSKCQPSSSVFYTSVSGLVDVSWNGADNESDIFDYEVGIAKSVLEDFPSYSAFVSTKGHTSYFQHISLLDHGIQYYIGVRAVNKAGQSSTAFVGPIVVDTTPPLYSGKLLVSQSTENFSLVCNSCGFQDPEQEGHSLSLQVAAGTSPGHEDVIPLTSLSAVGQENCCPYCECFKFEAEPLASKLYKHNIFFLVIATNLAGLSQTYASEPFTPVLRKPASGIVFDVKSVDDSLKRLDIDFQLNTNYNISCWWNGFTRSSALFVGVGTSRGTDNLVTFTNVDLNSNFAHFANVSLVAGLSSYFCNVKGRNEFGETLISSDGVRVVKDVLKGVVFDGKGCSGPSSLLNANYTLKEGSCLVQDDGGLRGNWFAGDCTTFLSFKTIPGQSYTISFAVSKSDNVTLSVFANARKIASDSSYISNETLVSAQFQTDASVSKIVITFAKMPNDSSLSQSRVSNVSFRHCSEDIDFQYSIVEASAHCRIPYHEGVSFYKWNLVSDELNGEVVISTGHSAKNCQAPVTLSADLIAGKSYRFIVEPCNSEFCFDTISSDGFSVIHSHPIPSLVSVSDVLSTSLHMYNLSVSLSPFKTLANSDVNFTVKFYEWAVEDRSSHMLIIPWTPLSFFSPKKAVTFTSSLHLPSAASQHINFVVKGYNEVGLSSEAKRVLEVPEKLRRKRQLVIDIDTRLSKNNWTDFQGTVDDDVDYTQNLKTVGFFWKSNTAKTVKWILLSDKRQWASCNSSAYALNCGVANASVVIVSGSLEPNHRYYFCILDATAPDSSQSVCSDGVTVDTSAPEPGLVEIGGTYNQYQTYSNMMLVRWSGFSDVEEENPDMHVSGIEQFCVAVGTHREAADIAFKCVRETSMWLFSDLHLQSGSAYYASVTAIDFSGLETKVSSSAIFVDTTPPTAGTVSVSGGDRGHFGKNSDVTWQSFDDKESGISHYEWCTSSDRRSCDIQARRVTKKSHGIINFGNLLSGHVYFFLVEAHNYAGLKTQVFSNGFGFDETAPEVGFVQDGLSAEDSDYTTELGTLSASWDHFSDFQSGVSHYSVAFGTLKGDSDVSDFQNVGLATDIQLHGLPLVPGIRYFATIEACNGANMCLHSFSDGVIVDPSPPLLGVVWDGLDIEDVQFQGTDAFVGGKWFGFQDPHSGIAYFRWCVGTNVGTSDIVSWTKTFAKEGVGIKTGPENVPENRMLYTSVKAYNPAGLWSAASSDGYIVDKQPPKVVDKARIVPHWGSLNRGTQISPSFLTASWNFSTSSRSPVTEHIVSFHTDRNATEAHEPLILGSQNSATFTNLALEDGFLYYVTVTACSKTRLCTQSTSDPVLIDSSIPHSGRFLDSLRLEKLNNVQNVFASWVGFVDSHSGIKSYVLSVGDYYSGYNLASNVSFRHLGGPDSIQEAYIPISKMVSVNGRLYISLWAINGAGLKSEQVQVSALANNEFLSIEYHSCPVESCKGECTCSILCKIPANLTCSKIPDLPNATVQVYDSLDYEQTSNYQALNSALFGSWKVSNASSFRRYQFSAGTQEGPGYHVFDFSRDEIWHEAGYSTKAIIPLKPPRQLGHRYAYFFFVRAWYNSTHYVIFQSPGVTVDMSPPSAARAVLDVNPNVEGDADFTTNATHLAVSWKQSFSDFQSGMDYFRCGIGSVAKGDDVFAFHTLRPDVEKFEKSFLPDTLRAGLRYFGTVQAVNRVGLATARSTDGILIDVEKPLGGVVYDGDQKGDIEFQSSTSEIVCTWHGFFDRHSFIDYYDVGFTASKVNVSFERAGLSLVRRSTNMTLVHGQRYYAVVKAVDAAGLSSNPVFSNGVLVDVTPPRIDRCEQFGDNILSNVTQIAMSPRISEANKWSVVHGKVTLSPDSESIFLSGEIRHSVSLKAFTTYELLITAKGLGPRHSQHVHLMAPGISQSIWIDKRGGSGRYKFFFTSTSITDGYLVLRAKATSANLLQIFLVELAACSFNATNVSSGFYGSLYYSNSAPLDFHWSMTDLESFLRNYQWSAGTVVGGQQLVSFTSTGTASAVRHHHLTVQHGTKFYISILGTNSAGLSTIIHSPEITADFTAPKLELRLSIDGVTNTVSLDWLGTHDDESGIDFCEWGIGSMPLTDNLVSSTRALIGATSASATVMSLTDGDDVYGFVRCSNLARLTSELSTFATVVQDPPSSKKAYLRLENFYATYRKTLNGFQADPGQLHFSWGGFHDSAGIAYYEFSVNGSDLSSDWTPTGLHTSTALKDLNMTSGTEYNVSVRAVNKANIKSSILSKSITILTNKPKVTGIPKGKWVDGKDVEIFWGGCFGQEPSSLSHDLVYELSVGSAEGTANIVQWIELYSTSYRIPFSSVNGLQQLFVTVTGINAAGLSSTSKGVISRYQ